MVDTSYRPDPSLTRPPTPPRENIEDSAKLPIGNTFQGTLGQQILLNTPEESPSSSSEYFNGPGGKFPKRVVFSPWTDYSYHKPRQSGGKGAFLEEKLRVLPPSKECIASRKSILKVSTSSSSPLVALSHQLVLDPNETVAAMLRSVNQHLDGASRDSRLDSYRTLVGCLSSYEDVPDSESLTENLTGFLEHTRRDIFAKQPGSGFADLELASNALKVLGTILYTPGLTNAVPHEFAIFIAEQAISSLENHDTPKIMLDHYMQLLSRQKMSSKVITNEKSNRILSALLALETHVKGNRVVALKLMIYQRLLVQAKGPMVARAEEWLEFLLSSMSSFIKDIRLRAIAFGTDAALALGTTSAVSQSLLDILNRDTPAGPKVVDVLGKRLLEVLNVKNEGFHVPQVWLVIVLFLRSRRRQIEKWEHFKAWLGIMERAFNSSEAKVKLQANITWNRLVAIVNLDNATGPSLIKVLRQPIASQLERKKSDNQPKYATSLARSTYCNLLYYSFCPGATHEQLDLYWDAFVAPLLSVRPSMTRSDVDFSCDVLTALLSSSQSKVWDQNRAHQLSPMKLGELPCLDPKWIRTRGAKVTKLLEDMLLHRSLTQSDDVQHTPLFNAWQSFAKAIGDAAIKEVKVSMDTMAAIAHIISSLSRYWNHPYSTPEVISRRLELFIGLVNETVTKIGFRPFLEKRVLRSSGNCFEATETPTSRTGRPRGTLNAPIAYIIDIVVNSLQISEPPSTYPEAIKTLLSIALRGTTGRNSHLVLLRELANHISSERSTNAACRLTFWKCIAKETTGALSLPQAVAHVEGNRQYLGNDYKEAVRLLEMAIKDIPAGFDSEWEILSHAVVNRIQTESCQEGITLIYTEPLAKAMYEQLPETGSDHFLQRCTHLLSHTSWPESRQALERASRSLCGPMSIPHGPLSLDPFDHLYSLLERLLIATYSNFEMFSINAIAAYLTGVKSFVLCCPLSFRAVCLERMQRGLANWIEDDNVILRGNTNQELAVLTIAIRELWKILTDAIKSVPKHDSLFLAGVQDLMLAGFQSHDKSVVDDTIMMWNQSFSKAETLEYPPRLHAVLSRLRRRVVIGLPGFVDDAEAEIVSSPFNFVESQDEQYVQRKDMTSIESTRSPEQEPSHDKVLPTPKHRLADKPRSSLEKSSRRGPTSTPKGRLRHDNSQIHFAAIGSSPLMASSIESQHLTDHQKEVKELQEQSAAAMFPDIRSSPRRSRSAERPPKLVLHKKQAVLRPLDVDADPSPTFPPGDTNMNEFLGSSPTPHSTRESPVRHRVSQGSVSTPQGFPPFTLVRHNAGESRATAQGGELEHGSKLANAAPRRANELPERNGSSPDSQDEQNAVVDQRDRAFEPRTAKGATPSISDSEDFFDAPVHPEVEEQCDANFPDAMVRSFVPEAGQFTNAVVNDPCTPRRKSGCKSDAVFIKLEVDDNVNDDANSAMVRLPTTPTEDELAREQLLRDLEEASSQGSSKVSRRRPSLSSPSEKGRKRKTQQNRGTKPRKRTKSPVSLLSCEVVVEKRKPDQEVDDCIILDDRPAAGEKESKTPPIKEEEESSFQVRDFNPLSEKTLAPSSNPTRRRTRSMASYDPQQPSIAEHPRTPAPHLNRIRTRSDSHETNRMDMPPRKRQCIEKKPRASFSIEDSNDDFERSERATVRESQIDTAVCMPPVGNGTPPTIEDDITSSQMEHVKDLLTRNPTLMAQEAGEHRPSSRSSDGDTVLYNPDDEVAQAEEARAAQEVSRSPGQRMLDRFIDLLRDIRHVTFWPEEERRMVEVAFEVVKDVHESGRRNNR